MAENNISPMAMTDAVSSLSVADMSRSLNPTAFISGQAYPGIGVLTHIGAGVPLIKNDSMSFGVGFTNTAFRGRSIDTSFGFNFGLRF